MVADAASEGGGRENEQGKRGTSGEHAFSWRGGGKKGVAA
jgi:hypothetical protein